MTDTYLTPTSGFADISAFVADANAINAATKTALNTALTNIAALMNPAAGSSAAHTDFERTHPLAAHRINQEITVLKAAVTAHA